jgi:hypothetical protein
MRHPFEASITIHSSIANATKQGAERKESIARHRPESGCHFGFLVVLRSPVALDSNGFRSVDPNGAWGADLARSGRGVSPGSCL